MLRGEFAVAHACRVHEKIHRQILGLEQVSAVDVGFAIGERQAKFWDFLAIRIHVNRKLPPELLVRAGISNLSNPAYVLDAEAIASALADGSRPGAKQYPDCRGRASYKKLTELLRYELKSKKQTRRNDKALLREVRRYPINGVRRGDLSIFCTPEFCSNSTLENVRLCICGVPIDLINALYSPSINHPGGDADSGVFAEPMRRTNQLDNDENLLISRGRVNPLVGGVSIGSVTGQAGTLGTIVWDRVDGTPCILSNWHVLAATATAQVGQPTYQPALFDGGTEEDVVAHLKRWTLGEEGDAAIAELSGRRHYASGEILGLWHPISGYVPPELNLEVRKWGRTTGFTQGFIDGIHLAINIDYGGGVIRYFKNQFHIAPLYRSEDVSQVGDSGSLVFTSLRPTDLRQNLTKLCDWLDTCCAGGSCACGDESCKDCDKATAQGNAAECTVANWCCEDMGGAIKAAAAAWECRCADKCCKTFWVEMVDAVDAWAADSSENERWPEFLRKVQAATEAVASGKCRYKCHKELSGTLEALAVLWPALRNQADECCGRLCWEIAIAWCFWFFVCPQRCTGNHSGFYQALWEVTCRLLLECGKQDTAIPCAHLCCRIKHGRARLRRECDKIRICAHFCDRVDAVLEGWIESLKQEEESPSGVCRQIKEAGPKLIAECLCVVECSDYCCVLKSAFRKLVVCKGNEEPGVLIALIKTQRDKLRMICGSIRECAAFCVKAIEVFSCWYQRCSDIVLCSVIRKVLEEQQKANACKDPIKLIELVEKELADFECHEHADRFDHTMQSLDIKAASSDDFDVCDFVEILKKKLFDGDLLEAIEKHGERFLDELQDQEARNVNRVYYAVGMTFAGDTPGSPFGEFAVASDIARLEEELRFSLRPVYEPRSSFRELRVRPQSRLADARALRSRRPLTPGDQGADPRGGGPQPDLEPAEPDSSSRSGGS
ncbi:MAG: hypothetical protein GY719_21415 [bacterium]|nr:hypothetical protein [bacterium]